MPTFPSAAAFTEPARRSAEPDDPEAALQRLHGEGARLVDRGAEDLDVVLPRRDPPGPQDAVGGRGDLGQGRADRVGVPPVLARHVAEEARAEGDVAVVVTRD